MNDEQVMALTLSLAAGASTCLGAAVVFLRTNILPRHLSFSLALAGSVMITVSCASILPESFTDNEDQWLPLGSSLFWERTVGFAIGCGIYFILSKCAFPEPDAILGLEQNPQKDGILPATQEESNAVTAPLISDTTKGKKKEENKTFQRKRTLPLPELRLASSDDLSNVSSTSPPLDRTGKLEDDKNEKPASSSRCKSSSWIRYVSGADLSTTQARRNWRVALLLFVSLAVHNFPEGLAVAASSMHSPRLGLTTAIAIALHNIPEGIAIAVPYLAARPDAPWSAFLLAGASGLTEPLGALVALLVIEPSDEDADDQVTTGFFSMQNILAFTAGIMIMAAVTELLPEALRYRQEGIAPFVLGTVIGAVVMLASDAVLEG